MKFISVWAGDFAPEAVPDNLAKLYKTVRLLNAQGDPEVCAERERVPVEELLEPFGLSEHYLREASLIAKEKSLRLATTVVGIYSTRPPETAAMEPPEGGFRFLGTFRHESDPD